MRPAPVISALVLSFVLLAPRSASAVAPPTFVRNFAGPGLADMYPVDVSASSSHLFVLDPGRYRVVKVARASGDIVATFGGHRGKSQTRIGAARAIARDDAGFVYVADTANNRVVKLTSDLAWVTAWGNRGTGPGQFEQDYGVAVGDLADGTDIVYVADGANGGRVQAFGTNGSFIRQFGEAQLTKPRQLVVDRSNGWIHVIDAQVKKVMVFDRSGTFRFAYGNGLGTGAGQFKQDPRGIDITSDGRAFVSDPGNERVQVWALGAGSANYVCSIGSAGTGPSDFEDIRGIAVPDDGSELVVTDEWDFSVKRYALSGAGCPSMSFVSPKLFGGLPPIGGFNSPRGLSVSPNGRVFGVDWWNQRIQRFESNGSGAIAWGVRGTRPQLGTLNFPWDVDVQPGTGRVFVANRESHEIEVFDQDGTPVTDWGVQGTSPGQFKFPQGVAFSPDGSQLWITDSGNNRIQRCNIQTSGDGTGCVAFGQAGGGAGQFKVPTGISVGPDGSVWVADTQNNRIQRRLPGGSWTVHTQPGGTTKKFLLPWGVSVDDGGDVWVADSANQRIVRMTADGTQVYQFTGTQVGAGAFDYPFDVAFLGTRVLISDTWNNRIVELQS
jgi:tripartite motif-containing protein 71